MSIDIQGLPGGRVQNTGDAKQGKRTHADANSTAAAPAAAGQSPDSVRLTDSATRLRQLESTLANLPVVDAHRVESVQRQLATGSFVVDSVESADKMIELERSLP